MASEALQLFLNQAREKHGVVGASLGVLRGGTVETCASGLLNLGTGVECTTDSVFQIGSISKVFTTTLIMQLLDQRRLQLDDAVSKYLPDFTLADPAAAKAVTIRQLLNHTSGMDGDFFPADDPEGPSTASYVRKMCLLSNLYLPLQGPVTYCNSGFAVAGRIVEVLTGMTWQTAVMELICKPLKMPAAFAHPHEALRFRCAMGHVSDEKDPDKIIVAPGTYLPLSLASMGSVLTMSTESLLRFAAAHMSDGEYDGARIVSAAAARAMRENETPLLPFSHLGATHWGLGWFLCKAENYRMAGHDGGTLGHFTYLRTFPEKGMAFTLLTNSPSQKLFREVEQHLMQKLLGTPVHPEPPAAAFTPRLARYVGRYSNIAGGYEITERAGKLQMRVVSKSGAGPEINATLEPYAPEVFSIRAPKTPYDDSNLSFVGERSGDRPLFLRMGLRMARAEPTLS